MARPDTDDLLCPDWIFSNTSNVHACKSRAWFTEYTPFTTTAGSIYNPNHGLAVAGIGTVIVYTRKGPNRTGAKGQGEIVLNDVLHTPDSVCNVFALTDDFRIRYPEVSLTWGENSLGHVADAEGQRQAYFDPKAKLIQLKLSGRCQPLGPSSFKEGVSYVVNVQWGDTERARWESYKRKHARSPTSTPPPSAEASRSASKRAKTSVTYEQPPYTVAEMEWLKSQYRGEFHFLESHSLSIYKEEDREEGRAILRALLSKSASKKADTGHVFHGKFLDDHEGNDEDQEDFDEAHLEGHMADYQFDTKSLDWMEEHYGSSMNFVTSFGLKFYKDEDCRQAQQIVRAILDNSDDEM